MKVTAWRKVDECVLPVGKWGTMYELVLRLIPNPQNDESHGKRIASLVRVQGVA